MEQKMIFNSRISIKINKTNEPMKRVLLTLGIAFSITAQSQTCTPDTVHPSMASIGYPTLEWSGLWVNGETPSFACDSTQPMMNLLKTPISLPGQP